MTTKQGSCDAAGSPVRLTRRQREILALVAQGATDNEIACRLCLSSGYVSNQMKKIRRRLGACSRAHAVALALRLGILDAKPQAQGHVIPGHRVGGCRLFLRGANSGTSPHRSPHQHLRRHAPGRLQVEHLRLPAQVDGFLQQQQPGADHPAPRHLLVQYDQPRTVRIQILLEDDTDSNGRAERRLAANELDDEGRLAHRLGYPPTDAPCHAGDYLATLHRPDGKKRLEGKLSPLWPQQRREVA